jgi:Cu-Zn family superoxide dismutase
MNLTVLGILLSMANAPGGGWAIPMYRVDESGIGPPIGMIQAADGKDGLVLKPQLKGLPPGAHGFHVHENLSCAPAEKDGKPVAALAAGGHYDPQETKKHAGPKGQGHLGDLPALQVAPNGTATQPVSAPRLKLADLKGRTLVIHAGADNYSDEPAPLGGGGARIACGLMP